MKRLQTFALACIVGLPALVLHVRAQTQFTTLYTFADFMPTGLAYGDGQLYGIGYGTAFIDCGSVFALQPPSVTGGAWTETVLWAFQSQFGYPCTLLAPPLPGPNGILYGFTAGGGTYGSGTVFELQPPTLPGGPWTETVIYNFGSDSEPIGVLPEAMIQGPSGSLYVTTDVGVAGGSGAVGQLLPPAVPGGQWTGVLLYSFPTTGVALPPLRTA